MSESFNEDVKANKVYGILAYIIFFIPLLAARESKFAMYHANQGLVLFLLYLAVNVVCRILPLTWLLLPFAGLFFVVLAILGIINAANGETKPLPLIGHFVILK